MKFYHAGETFGSFIFVSQVLAARGDHLKMAVSLIVAITASHGALINPAGEILGLVTETTNFDPSALFSQLLGAFLALQCHNALYGERRTVNTKFSHGEGDYHKAVLQEFMGTLTLGAVAQSNDAFASAAALFFALNTFKGDFNPAVSMISYLNTTEQDTYNLFTQVAAQVAGWFAAGKLLDTLNAYSGSHGYY